MFAYPCRARHTRLHVRLPFSLILVLMLILSACLPATSPPTAPAITDESNSTESSPSTADISSEEPDAEPTAGGSLGALLNAAVPTSKAAQPNAAAILTPTQTTTGTNSLAALLPTVTPTPRVTATPTPPASLRASITVAQVNVRGGPGTNYAIVGKAQAGDTLEVVGRTETGDWLRVCCPVNQATESWISAEFLLVDMPNSDALTTLPVPEIPPTPDAPVATGGGGGSSSGNKSAADIAAATAPGMPGPGNFPAPGGTNPLTGLDLPGGRAGQRPVIVCINNDYAARPQFGTSQADVVYEYLMEGYGITRFSAVYYGSDVGTVGPIRSARLINYYMGGLYDAGLVCSGASDAVRYSLKFEAPFPYMDIDLDDPSNARYSVSIGSDYRTRLRTDTSKLHRWLADWGVEKPASIRGFTFGNLPGGGAPATSISIPYPRATGSQVSYVYDAGSGRYLRSLGGAAHVDGNTGAQLGLENVIVQVVTHEATNIVEDSLGSTSIRLNLFGSGSAILFRDGQAFVGTWRSDSRGDTPRFYDAQGNEIALKPGRSWISVVPDSYTIDYQ